MPESRVGCEMQGHEIMHISILDPRQLPCTQTDPHLIRKILCIVQQRTQGWSTIRTTRGDGYPARGGGGLVGGKGGLPKCCEAHTSYRWPWQPFLGIHTACLPWMNKLWSVCYVAIVSLGASICFHFTPFC